MLDLAVILVAASVAAALARRCGQPPVIGEVVAGLLLGPTLLGPWSASLFPATSRPALEGIADVGVALFMFGLGLDFGRGTRAVRTRAVGGIVLGSTGLPFAAGVLLALGPAGHGNHGDRLAFALFMGTALAVTAVPVLARILLDTGMMHTAVGRLALSAAVVCDVLAWSLLAAAAAVAGSGTPWRLAALVPFVALLASLGRRSMAALHSWADRDDRDDRRMPLAVTVTLGCALACAALTELIGLHLIFGAFLFGLTLPRHGPARVTGEIRDYAHRVSALLLPVYFTVAGLEVLIRPDLSAVGLLALIVAVASASKLLGTYGAARVGRVAPRPAAVLAMLMNTRGLTELVVLTTGLQLGILDQRMYSLMVCMAIITTMATGPLLRRIRVRPDDPVVDVEKAA